MCKNRQHVWQPELKFFYPAGWCEICFWMRAILSRWLRPLYQSPVILSSNRNKLTFWILPIQKQYSRSICAPLPAYQRYLRSRFFWEITKFSTFERMKIGKNGQRHRFSRPRNPRKYANRIKIMIIGTVSTPKKGVPNKQLLPYLPFLRFRAK